MELVLLQITAGWAKSLFVGVDLTDICNPCKYFQTKPVPQIIRQLNW
jgi:hypothetical protein